MSRLLSASLAAAGVYLATAGCASYPAPVQRLADAQAAARSAEDTGAQNDPQAQLHLKLAKDGIAEAKGLMQNEDNERADYVLIRAKGDAELALSEAREQQTRADAEKAIQEVATFQANNSRQPTSTTTTTGAVITTPAPPTTA